MLDEEVLRAIYTAALERCAEWHENHPRHTFAEDTMHNNSAATIRQWIEKEKANG